MVNRSLPLVVVCLSASAWADSYLLAETTNARFTLAQAEVAPDASADLIRTKDGKLHVGRIIDRTPSGYLIRAEADGTTYVIDYANVDDLKSTAPVPVAPAARSPSPPSAALAPAPSPSFLLDSAKADLAKLEEEYGDNGLFSPIFKMVLAAVCFGIAPVALRNLTEPIVPGLLVVGGFAFGITGVVQLILRIGARHRLEPRIEQQRAYVEKLEAWAASSQSN